MQDRWLPFPRTRHEVEVMGWNVTTASAIEVQKAKPLHGRVASRSPVELCWVFHASPLPTRSGSDCFAGFAGANKIHATVLREEQPLIPALVMPAKAECLVESPALAGTTIGSMGPSSLYTCQVARASYLVFQSWRNSTAGCKRTRIREEFPKPGCFALQSGRAFLLALCIASWVRRLQPVTCWQ